MLNTQLKVVARKGAVLGEFPRDAYLGKGDFVGNGLKPSKRKDDFG